MLPSPQIAPILGDEWKVGKDARTIAYIEKAEAGLAPLPMAKFAFDLEVAMDTACAELKAELDELKAGRVTLDEHLTHKFFTELPVK